MSEGLNLDPTMDRIAKAMHETLIKHEGTTHRLANLSNPSFQALLDQEDKKLSKRREVLLEETVRDLQKYSARYSSLASLLRSRANILRTVLRQGR